MGCRFINICGLLILFIQQWYYYLDKYPSLNE